MDTAAFGEVYVHTCEDEMPGPARVFDDSESQMTWRTMIVLLASCILFYTSVIEVCRIILGGRL